MRRPSLVYSGFITNYICTAKCRHCLYGCSQKAPHDFISAEIADKLLGILAANGVRSMHIGGGEPFLNFETLCETVSAFRRHGIGVDYIETNAFWARDEKTVIKYCEELRRRGVYTIMASADPFHIEFVPLERPLLLCSTLDKLGMDYFIWQQRYVRRLAALDMKKTHSHDELKRCLGRDYVEQTAGEYGLDMNGRALNIARSVYKPRPVREVASSAPCTRLLSGQHAHVDLYGGVIPPGCPGISIAVDDYFSHPERICDKDRYPVISRLLQGGTKALLSYAQEKGFKASPAGYATNCELCYELRRFLRKSSPSSDIAPDCFYQMMET